MQNRPPAARAAGLDVFQPVINVNQILAAPAGQIFQCLVNFRVRLHRADFVGKNVAVKFVEKREIAADMLDGKVVGVRENVSFETALPHFRVKQMCIRDSA